MGNINNVIPTFVIFLREGIEASMIVAILLAYLDKIGQRRHFRDVFVGVAAAMVLVLIGGVTAYLVLVSYAGSDVQTIFETVTYLVAATVLTYMTFWMNRHGRHLASELRQRAEAALDGRARWGLGMLAFQAVGREGVETMVFTLAIVFASSGRAAITGGMFGLAVSLGMAFGIYRLGKKINVALFFRVVGLLLVFFAAGLLVDAVENMQSLGWLPTFGHLWSTAGMLSEDSTLGDIFHSFFGYADNPTVLQAVVYIGYLAVVVTGIFGVASTLGRRHLERSAARRSAVGS